MTSSVGARRKTVWINKILVRLKSVICTAADGKTAAPIMPRHIGMQFTMYIGLYLSVVSNETLNSTNSLTQGVPESRLVASLSLSLSLSTHKIRKNSAKIMKES